MQSTCSDTPPLTQSILDGIADAQPLAKGLRTFFPPSRTGKPNHLSTGLRWIHKGVVGPNGERVKLSAIKVGGVTYIRRQDAEAFLLALNADTPAAQQHADADFARRAKECGAALEKLGC